jgi:hypothetical protein
MNFIQKLIQQNKQKKVEQLKNEYSFSIIKLEDHISILKNDIITLQNQRKNILPDFIDKLSFHLILLEKEYVDFLCDLKAYEYDSEYNCFKNRKENARKKAEYMQKLKKQYRVEFEKIYDSFKRISKGCDFPNRNKILNQMRKAFDFDNSRYLCKTGFELRSSFKG